MSKVQIKDLKGRWYDVSGPMTTKRARAFAAMIRAEEGDQTRIKRATPEEIEAYS